MNTLAQIPFSLEVVEAALVTATGRLEGELAQIQPSVKSLLGRLPQEITPVSACLGTLALYSACPGCIERARASKQLREKA